MTTTTATTASIVRKLNELDCFDVEIEHALNCRRSEIKSALQASLEVPTASYADTARRLHQEGMTIGSIARAVGQRYSTVYRAIKGW